jgi:hypothetical protein
MSSLNNLEATIKFEMISSMTISISRYFLGDAVLSSWFPTITAEGMVKEEVC